MELSAAKTVQLDIALHVQAEKQEVTVKGEPGPQVSVEPDNNAGALVLRGADLDALSDDPDDLAADLQALAGPSAGPNGGQIFIDGFSGGPLPPKENIREIRINQNPFSAEYDQLGYGRIEILTKPGTDKFHGSVFFTAGNNVFNSRYPYAPDKPDFMSKMFEGSVTGPVTKKSSFSFQRRAPRYQRRRGRDRHRFWTRIFNPIPLAAQRTHAQRAHQPWSAASTTLSAPTTRWLAATPTWTSAHTTRVCRPILPAHPWHTTPTSPNTGCN